MDIISQMNPSISSEQTALIGNGLFSVSTDGDCYDFEIKPRDLSEEISRCYSRSGSRLNDSVMQTAEKIDEWHELSPAQVTCRQFESKDYQVKYLEEQISDFQQKL
jgi:hypothetical protein